jgi:ribonuclease/clavin/mitogillin
MSATKTPRQGAALILLRRDGAVLCGHRTTSARSWPGTLAFPGGSVDDDDDELPLWTRTPGLAGKQRAAALREALEEAGVVRLCTETGAPVRADVAAAVVDDVRAGAPLKQALVAHRAWLDDRGLHSLGTWLTAEGTFLVTRFLVAVDGDDVERVAPLVDEISELAWRSAAAIVAGWRAGEVYLLPPIRLVLTRLAALGPGVDVDVAARALTVAPTEAERRRRDLVHGVCTLDMRTPTLWPATTTNCVMLGTDDVLLVDPATPYDDERARFDDTLAHTLEGRRVQGVFLTHHHHDHVGDALRVARSHGVPVYAHKETRARVDDDLAAVCVDVDDGHVFALGDRTFRAVHTPGHAVGHLCLFDDDASLLIAGDMVAGVGSILIDPDEGHVATYCASLERLIALAPRALIPSHGPLLVNATGRLSDQLAHRHKRTAMVRAAIDAGAEDVDAVVTAVYGADTPPAMFAFAARSVLAMVQQLVEAGVVDDDNGRYRAATGS